MNELVVIEENQIVVQAPIDPNSPAEIAARRERLGFKRSDRYNPTPSRDEIQRQFRLDREALLPKVYHAKSRRGPDENLHVGLWRYFQGKKTDADGKISDHSKFSFEDAIFICCTEAEIEVVDFFLKTRKRKFAFLRQHFMYLALTKCRATVSQIAHYLDFDHTTVLHGIKVYCARNGIEDPDTSCKGGFRKIRDNRENLMSISDICTEVLNRHGVTLEQFLFKRGRKNLKTKAARGEFVNLAVKRTNFSYAEIGNFMGRHLSVVSYYLHFHQEQELNKKIGLST